MVPEAGHDEGSRSEPVRWTRDPRAPGRGAPTKGTARYDLILDNVGNHSMAETRRALTPTGTLISNGCGQRWGKLGRTLRTMLVSMFVRQQASPTVKTQNRDDLVVLKELVEACKIMPVIDGTYPLSEAPKAIARVASGRARGTLVIAVLAAHPRANPEPLRELSSTALVGAN